MKINVDRVMWIAMFIGICALIVFALAFAAPARAADANLSWTHPTQRVDGTALPLSSIKETQLDWAVCASGNTFPTTPAGSKAVPAPSTTTTVTGLTYGTWCFRARSVDTGNLVSDNTGTVWKQYLAPPNPPVLTVINIVAYEYIPATWRKVARLGKAVGTVPLGTECGVGVLRDYYTVPREAVRFTRSTRYAVVAQCATARGVEESTRAQG